MPALVHGACSSSTGPSTLHGAPRLAEVLQLRRRTRAALHRAGLARRDAVVADRAVLAAGLAQRRPPRPAR